MDINTLAGRAIRTAREAERLSRTALLERAGHPLTLRWLVALEQGRARWRIADLDVLARAMGHDLLDLLAKARLAS